MISILIISLLSGIYCYLFNFIPLSPWFNFLWAFLSIVLAIISYVLFVIIFVEANKKTKPTGKFRYKLARDIVRIIFLLTNTKVEYVGKENVPNETFVCYANHRSAMDVFVTHYGLNRVCSVIGKKSLFKYPIIKDFQYTFGCIALDRENDRAGAKQMVEAMRHIKNGLSYIIFPEGTRNKTEEVVLKAKEGSFKLVTKTEVPLLPCTIIGTDAYSKRRSIFKRVKVKVIFHEPIYNEEYSQYNTTEISNQVMEIIKKDLINNK